MEAGTDIDNVPHTSQLRDVESHGDGLHIHTLPSVTEDHLSNQISTDEPLPAIVPSSASRAGSPSHTVNDLPLAIAWVAEGDAGQLSRSESPENEDLSLDEPSSVLASRIIRAHDNPSPPPASPNFNISISAPLIDFSASPIKFSTAVANSSESVSNDVPAASSPSLQPEIPDLFSANEVPSLMHHIDTHGANSNGIFSPLVHPSLSSLPSPPSRSSDGSDFPLVDLHSPSSTPKAGTVDDVLGQVEEDLRSLGVEAEKIVVPPPSCSDGTLEEAPVLNSTFESPLPQTPLRRSTRPRLGTSRVPEVAEQASIATVAPLSIQRKKGKQKAEDPESLDAATPARPASQGSKGSKRELSSLSPTSDHLLSSLVPTPERKSPNSFSPAKDLIPSASSTDITQFTFPIPFTPLRTAPVRVLNPLWPGASPSKPGMDDSTRTPARRIPVEQAAVQAQVALREAKTFFIQHTPNASGSKRLIDSPTKRHISQVLHFKPPQERQSSPTRLIPERSKSAEPRPLAPAVTKNSRSTSLEPSFPSQRSLVGSTEVLKMGSLPFPLVIQPSIAEETEMLDNTGNANMAEKAAAQSTTLTTSSLKQTTTKIPRIANKPYARPGPGKGMTTSKVPVKDAKALTPAKVAEQPKVKPPISKPKQRTVEKSTLVARSAFPTRPVEVSSTSAIVAPSLKRKRDVPMDKVVPPVIKQKPIAVVRQVPTAPSKSQATPVGVAPKATTANRATGVNNRSGPTLRVRRVVDKKQPQPNQLPSLPPGEQAQFAPPRPPSPQASIPPEAQNTSTMQDILPAKASTFSPPREFGLPTTGAQVPETDDPHAQLDISSQPNAATDQEFQMSLPLNESATNIPPAPQPAVPNEKSTLRRTTRARKTASQTLSDEEVFRNNPPTVVQPRRGRGTGSRAGIRDGVANGFAGMSALSLKALTTTNTTRNQRYMAITLATEVVRKEGARPASPGMKIKTVLQRQEEEKEKQKQERADRRARRADGFTATSLGGADMDRSFDGSDDSDSDDHLPVLDQTEEFSIPPGKYRRGAGEDEDYETPDRPDTKRRRLGDGQDGQTTCAEKRRVKWDKGLFTAIYLDEILPGSRHSPAGEVISKGCLAPTAKSMQLDLMGNPPNAESLPDIPQESVVIQRFVYDDELAPTEPPPLPAPPPKNTRTKGKKGKST